MFSQTPVVLPVGLSIGEAAQALAAALGCGLLVGIERERRKGSGGHRALAGLRTFALACVMGAGAMLTGESGLVTVGALLLAALGAVAHARDRSNDPGVTTEIALLLTYFIGVLCVWSLPLAAALAVGMTALLAARERLHRFAQHWLRPAEVRDGIILAALVLIALPLMPNRPLWGQILNPYLIVQLLGLLLGIQALAHLMRRLLDARQAVAMSAIASGFVSSTATIASMGMSVREGRSGARLMAGAGLLSCVATMIQMLMVALALQPAWLKVLSAPALVSASLALAWGWWMVRGAPDEGSEWVHAGSQASDPAKDPERMFSLRGAAIVAGLLTGVQTVVYAMGLWLGDYGAMAGTLIAALVDLHSSLAAVFTPAPPDAQGLGVLTVILAFAVHSVSKSITAWFSGGWRYLVWLAPGLWLHSLLLMLWLAAELWVL